MNVYEQIFKCPPKQRTLDAGFSKTSLKYPADFPTGRRTAHRDDGGASRISQ